VKVTGARVFVVRDGQAVDAATGNNEALPDTAEDVINNNRMRGEIEAALSALQLFSADAKQRLLAVKALLKEPDITKLPMLEKALATEADASIQKFILLAKAAIQLNDNDAQVRLTAAKSLADSQTPDTQLLLNQRLSQEDNAQVRHQLEASLRTIQSALGWGEKLGALFTGISLASIGAGHHLRLDGRDQHGARRVDDDWRLRHLCGARRVSSVFAQRV
jgi:urea transport system permease protein